MLSVTDVRQFYLGVQGENEEQTITVDVKPWLASYPNGVVSIWHKRNGESVPTPTGAVYDAEAGTITWTPTYTDTYNAGEGEAEIRLYENGVIKKTRTVKTGVAPSVTGAAGVTLESGWQGMVNYIDERAEEVIGAKDDAVAAAEAAEEATTVYPRIGGNGNWMLWDAVHEIWTDTNFPAQGPAGQQGEQGEQGPTGAAGAPGQDGLNGVVMEITTGQYAFEIDENGHLILLYDGGPAPDFEIDENGHLIYSY